MRRPFSGATWVPLRASLNDETGNVRKIGYVGDVFACGTVAFPKQHRELAERLKKNPGRLNGLMRGLRRTLHAEGHVLFTDEVLPSGETMYRYQAKPNTNEGAR